MSGGVRRGGQEGPAHSGHSRDGGGGGGGGLQGGDLKVVPVAHLVCLGGAEGGHPGTNRAHRGGLGGVQGRAADTIRGLGGGGGDVGGESAQAGATLLWLACP